MGNERPARFQCSLCQRSFRRTEHLTRHERSHRNEKPFSCDYCDARFTRKDLIKGHMSRHHKDRVIEEPGRSAAATSLETYAPCYQPDAIPQLWEQLGEETMYGGQLDMAEMLANAELPSLSFFGNETSAYPVVHPDQHEQRNNFVPDDIGPASTTPVASATSMNSGPTPENSWHTAFDILEEKRVEMATMMRYVLQPVQAESDIMIPSAIAFRRYIAVFFDVFHTSLPFMHGPSWRANDQEPALLFSVAAIGAATCGKTLLSFDLHRSAQLSLWRHSKLHESRFDPSHQPIWVAQALLLIMFYGTYSGDATVMQEVLPYQSILASIVRRTINAEDFKAISRDDPDLTWEGWIGIETIIRTTSAIYIYFGQLNLVLDLPFALVNSEMDLHLPCSEEEWHVSTLESWRRFREQKKPCLIRFTEALKLMGTDQTENTIGWSPLGALVMLYGILQRIWYLRQVDDIESTSAQIEIFEKTLWRWKAMYGMGLQQSSLTNSSLPRALELDANALFKVTYFNLYANLHNPRPTLMSHSIDDVVSTIRRHITDGSRKSYNNRAAKCSTQVLLIIFNSGFVWRNKILTGASSLQFHIIASLECCLYLSLWLSSLYSVDAANWTPEESEIVAIVEAMLQEMDISQENYGKPIHIQLLYAWCGMFKDVGQSGVGRFLVSSIHEYAGRG